MEGKAGATALRFRTWRFIIKLFRANNSTTETVVVSAWDKGSGLYSVNGISIVGSMQQVNCRSRELVKVTDLIGREIDINTKNATILYIYDDGTVEKRYIVE